MYSVSTDVLMLHLRNQQLYARENRISRPSPIERRTVAQSPTERFGFSIFSLPRPSPHAPFHYAISPVPRLISDHKSSFVRSVMGVPLLSTREHAREESHRKERFTSRLRLRTLSVLFPIRSNFRTSFRCPCNHPCLRTCRRAVSKIFHAIPIRQTDL